MYDEVKFEILSKKLSGNCLYQKAMRPHTVMLGEQIKWKDLSLYLKHRLICEFLTEKGEEPLPYDIRNYKFSKIKYDSKKLKIIDIEIKYSVSV